MSSISRLVRVTGWMRPARTGGVPGSVTSIASPERRGVQLAGLQRPLAGVQRGLQLLAGAVRAGSHRSALLGRQVGDAAQDRGQLGLAAQKPDAQLLERVGVGRPPRSRRPPRPEALRFDRLRSCSFLAEWRPYPAQSDRRRGRDAKRLDGVGAHRNGPRCVGRVDDFAGESVALGAEADGLRVGRRFCGAAMGNQGNAWGWGFFEFAAADGDVEDRAHRGSNCLRAVGIGAIGPERDPGVGEGARAADDAPDVPGIPDAVEIDANRPLVLANVPRRTP